MGPAPTHARSNWRAASCKPLRRGLGGTARLACSRSSFRLRHDRHFSGDGAATRVLVTAWLQLIVRAEAVGSGRTPHQPTVQTGFELSSRYSSSVTLSPQLVAGCSPGFSVSAKWVMRRLGAAPLPVLLVGLEKDAIAGSDLLDCSAAALAAADAFGDKDRLAERVAVPGGPGAGREVHEAALAAGGRGGGNDGVDVCVAGEPVGGAFGGVEFSGGDLPGGLLSGGGGRGSGTVGSSRCRRR